MFLLQVCASLLCLLSLSCATPDPRRVVQMTKDVEVLEVDRKDLAKKYESLRQIANHLDQDLELVQRMDDVVHKYGIDQQFPRVAQFVQELKNSLKKTKIFTKQQMDKLEEEYQEKENRRLKRTRKRTKEKTAPEMGTDRL